MKKQTAEPEQATLLNPESYAIKTLEDEIRVDKLCKLLLQQYHQYLLENNNISPLQAGAHASGADYFLRDFMIDNRRINILEISPELIHRFAGNWYIISTLEPNMSELESILLGIQAFYHFCAEQKMVAPEKAEEIQQACSRIDYYRQRIDSFNEITGDGFIAWNSSCPL